MGAYNILKKGEISWLPNATIIKIVDAMAPTAPMLNAPSIDRFVKPGITKAVVS